MLENMNQSQEENNRSDYDAEWGLDESNSPVTPDIVNTEDTTPTDVADTVSDAPALEEQEYNTSEVDTSKAAELESDNVWADASPDQLKALHKAESDEKAMRGRFRLSNDKNTVLEQQLNELKAHNAKLEEQTREPTQFEQDHPEYAEDLKKLYGNQGGIPQPVSVDPADTILSTHSDAGEIYNSNEFQIWIGAQPKPVRQAIESNDAESIVEILNLYKQVGFAAQQTQQNADQEKLRGLSGVAGSSAPLDIRSPSSLSSSQQYDAEWETDDI
jgi:hypothetical protein